MENVDASSAGLRVHIVDDARADLDRARSPRRTPPWARSPRARDGSRPATPRRTRVAPRTARSPSPRAEGERPGGTARRAWPSAGHSSPCRRRACSAAFARTSPASTRVATAVARASTSPSTSTSTARTPVVYASCHGSIASYDHAHHVASGFGHELPPVLEPRPRDVGRRGDVVLAMTGERDAELVEHVGADAVGAEHDRVRTGRRTRVAHGVVHVRARDCARSCRAGRHRGGRRARAATRRQRGLRGASRRPQSTAPSATWMWTPTPRSRARPAAASSVSSRARERGVHADHPPPSGAQEPLVLGQPALGTIVPVAIGDAVCAHHADADLAARVGDDVERAIDGRGRLVMVDDRSGAALERLERAEHRRPPDHLEVERGIEPPPHLLEDLQELRRRRRRARACPAPTPSTDGDAAQTSPPLSRSRRSLDRCRRVPPHRQRVAPVAVEVVQRRARPRPRSARGRSRPRP